MESYKPVGDSQPKAMLGSVYFRTQPRSRERIQR